MRYIPLSPSGRELALKAAGAGSVEELFQDIPSQARFSGRLNIPGPLPEMDLMDWFESAAGGNNTPGLRKTFLGAGAYPHHTPAAVDHLISRTEFFTCYTPYQPEVSQGTLMAIYEFQTYAAALLGLDVANASMYDGPSALAEAVIMACRITGRNKAILPDVIHPYWRQVVKTYTQHMGVEIVEAEFSAGGAIDVRKLASAIGKDTAAVAAQSPNFFGVVEDMAAIQKAAAAAGAMLIGAVAEPVSLGLLKGPGAYGADIAVAEGRGFGGSLSYGGPALGMFAVKKDHARRAPGRLVGKTKDSKGRDGYTLTLATREQHIRREKATSNICSNQALMATSAAIHLSLLGAEGLRSLAERNLAAAHYLADRLASIPGIKMAFGGRFFNEFAVALPVDPDRVIKALSQEGFLAGLNVSAWYPNLKNTALFCATEVHSKESMDQVARIVARETK